jgi:hypothetical protein
MASADRKKAETLISKWQHDAPTLQVLATWEAEAAADDGDGGRGDADAGDEADDEEEGAPASAEGKEAKQAAAESWRDKSSKCFESKGEAKARWPDLRSLLPLLHQHVAQSPAAEAELVLAVGLKTARSFLSASRSKLRSKVEPWIAPHLLLAAIADCRHGRSVANFLVSSGAELLAACAQALHTNEDALRARAQHAQYQGPLLAFLSQPLQEALARLADAEREDALVADDEHAGLRLQWKHWFSAMPVTNADLESTIKSVKALTGQQRRDDRTVSRQLRLRLNDAPLWPVRLPSASIDDSGGEQKRAAAAPDRKQLRLTRADGEHPAFPQLTDAGRTKLNGDLGFNRKRTPDERKAAKEHVEKKLDVEQTNLEARGLLQTVSAAAPAAGKGTKRKRGSGGDDDDDDKLFEDGSGSSSGAASGRRKGNKRQRLENAPAPPPRAPSSRAPNARPSQKRLSTIAAAASDVGSGSSSASEAEGAGLRASEFARSQAQDWADMDETSDGDDKENYAPRSRPARK